MRVAQLQASFESRVPAPPGKSRKQLGRELKGWFGCRVYGKSLSFREFAKIGGSSTSQCPEIILCCIPRMGTRLEQAYYPVRALARCLRVSEVLRSRRFGDGGSISAALNGPWPSAFPEGHGAAVRWFSAARDDGDGDRRGAGEGGEGGGPSSSSSVWRFFTGGGGEDGRESSASRKGGDGDDNDDVDTAGSADGSRRRGGKPAGHADGSNSLVTSSPEQRYREVLSIPVYRRPLFPGVIMPVMVSDTRVIKELIDIRKQGAQAYVGTFLSTKGSDGDGSGFETEMEGDGDNLGDMFDGRGRLIRGLGRADEEGHHGTALDDDVSSLHEIGTFAQVHTVVPHDQGAQLLLLGHRRLRRTGVAQDDPLRCTVQHIKDEPYDKDDDMLKATTMELISTLKELLHMHPLYNEQMRNFIQFGADFHDPSRLADLAASLTSGDGTALQMVLEELRVPERIEQSLVLLRKEANLLQLQQDIGKRVEEKISKDQRRYFLMEQLKSIKKELGIEKDDKTALVQKFRERIGMGEGDSGKEGSGGAGLLLPETARKVIEEELTKLEGLEPASSEFNVTRNYLDWLTSLPWGKFGEERLDVGAAREVLDEDHYGLSDVKDRILEFIAVGKLRGSTQGKILCFVGPPGVGKTSIGKSIARSLDRAYYRFSVGGLSDVAEIKGHRRTYVGAMPGKMVQCLKSTGTSNPFVLIDEIDKLGRGYQGDPASALLELLDPEQNGSFLDHYLDVPVDLSKVLFVCTANQLDTIPGPLLDRMEVIQVSGYTGDEKVSIARTYLEPQANLDAGIPKGAVRLEDEALRSLVDEYAREAGVRSLKKLIEKVYRKAAFKLVDQNLLKATQSKASSKTADQPEGAGQDAKHTDDSKRAGSEVSSSMIPGSNNPSKSLEEQCSKWPAYEEPLLVVGTDNLVEYVGHPPYPSDKIYQNETPLGVVTGLAWTASGGATLYIEAASVEKGEGKGGLRATGQLGDVMKESTTIAHTFARRFLEEKFPENTFFAQHSLHVHVPAGATPKDGPSAGCAVVTALLSLAIDQPVRPDIAMTGEITLTGKVLPIGGVKEKALAAKRSEITTIVLPEGNRRDWDELSDDVKEGLQPHFVESYDKLFDLAFTK